MYGGRVGAPRGRFNCVSLAHVRNEGNKQKGEFPLSRDGRGQQKSVKSVVRTVIWPETELL